MNPLHPLSEGYDRVREVPPLRVVGSGIPEPDRPRPLQTLVVARKLPAGSHPDIEVVRRWETWRLARGGCGRCVDCTAVHGKDGQSICVVDASSLVDRSGAAAFSPDGI